jgi:hypothetical protein
MYLPLSLLITTAIIVIKRERTFPHSKLNEVLRLRTKIVTKIWMLETVSQHWKLWAGGGGALEHETRWLLTGRRKSKFLIKNLLQNVSHRDCLTTEPGTLP